MRIPEISRAHRLVLHTEQAVGIIPKKTKGILDLKIRKPTLF